MIGKWAGAMVMAGAGIGAMTGAATGIARGQVPVERLHRVHGPVLRREQLVHVLLHLHRGIRASRIL